MVGIREAEQIVELEPQPAAAFGFGNRQQLHPFPPPSPPLPSPTPSPPHFPPHFLPAVPPPEATENLSLAITLLNKVATPQKHRMPASPLTTISPSPSLQRTILPDL